MNQIIDIMLYSWVAGFASFIGAVIARVERIPEGVRKKELFRGIVGMIGQKLIDDFSNLWKTTGSVSI